MATKIRVAAADRVSDSRANEAHLKQRVKELEEEVSSLKRRLDELRKAKNTTVLKREREVLEIGAPFGRRESKSDEDKESLKRLAEKEKLWEKELSDVKRRYEDQLAVLRKSAEANKDCGHLEELEFLRKRNDDLENDNMSLLNENRSLRDKVDTLLSDLSIKEASWCEMEEKFKLEMKRTWGEKYKEWMDATEAKIEDLQRTNALLRTYLKNQRPNGPDPTRQDPDLDLL